MIKETARKTGAQTPQLQQAEELARTGMAALARRDGRGARAALERAISLGWPGAPVWLALAGACKMVGDAKARRRALERAVEISPASPRGLLAIGSFHQESGDIPGAQRAYTSALRALGGRSPPPALAPQLARARTFLAKHPDGVAAQLRALFADANLGDSAEDRLFALSLDILCGYARPCYQQPTRYLFPGLPQRQFYERNEFPWAQTFEAHTQAILGELATLRQQQEVFTPYVEASGEEQGRKAHALSGNPTWSAFHLVKQGVPIWRNITRCPAAYAAVDWLGWVARPAPAHSILFSRLAPGASIPPHHGQVNTRLICHLPLVVPDGCGFRVGNEVRRWRPGELLIFDDTIEHEAWNQSSEDRYILIFEIWRPELTSRQIELVTRLLASVGQPASPDP